MHISNCIVALACVGSLSVVAVAGEPMALLTDDRIVTQDRDIVWFDQDGNLNDLLSQQSFAPDEFEEWVFDRTDDVGVSNVFSSQDSAASSNSLRGSGFTRGIGSPEDGVDYLAFGVNSYNAYSVDFSIAEQTDFVLEVELFASNDGPGVESEVSLVGLGDSSFNYSVAGGAGLSLVDENFTLEPGSYRFVMAASFVYNEFATDVSASFDGGLRVVPGPSGVFVIGLGGLIGVRRRR